MGIATPFMKQTLDYIKSTVSTDGYGTLVETTVYTNVPCRFQGLSRYMLSNIGETVMTDAECWIGSAYTISDRYIFIYKSQKYHVVRYSEKFDLFGKVDYIKVYLRK